MQEEDDIDLGLILALYRRCQDRGCSEIVMAAQAAVAAADACRSIMVDGWQSFSRLEARELVDGCALETAHVVGNCLLFQASQFMYRL